jgi:hypothetical protein
MHVTRTTLCSQVSLGADFNPQTMIFFGDIQNQPGQQIVQQLGVYRIITGSLNVGVGGTGPAPWTTLPLVFNQVRSVGGVLTIQAIPTLGSLVNSFQNLAACGGLTVTQNTALQQLGNGFQNLKMVNGALTFTYVSPDVTSVVRCTLLSRTVCTYDGCVRSCSQAVRDSALTCLDHTRQ